MNLKNIPVNSFIEKPYDLWEKQWLLLTSGDFDKGDFNTMTVAWGGFGSMWGKPFAHIVVRPSRYTYEFLERYNDFTLTAFPKEYRRALNLLGTKSGRDGDKIAESGLTPIASKKVASPGFAEAELIVECKTIYKQDMGPDNFVDPSIERMYGGYDYHRIYYGEILYIQGVSTYAG